LSEANADVRAEAKQTQKLLEHRLAFETLISGISTNFINVAAADVDREIRKALESVGRFVGADRAYIYMFSDDGQSASLLDEWNADPNVARGLGGPIPVSAFPWTRERLAELQHVIISIDDLPPEAAAEREQFKRAGNQSMVVVPMIYNRAFLGALGVASAMRAHGATRRYRCCASAARSSSTPFSVIAPRPRCVEANNGIAFFSSAISPASIARPSTAGFWIATRPWLASSVFRPARS